MTTLAELRTKARNFIKDTSITQKVTDEELTDYASYAIADYSIYFPRSLIAEYEPDTTLDAPTDGAPSRDPVEAVEVSSEFWAKTEVGQGETLPTTGNFWYWRGGQIRLSSTPAATVYVHYRGLHTFLEPEDDGDGVLTVPQADEELLVIYMAAKFHQKVGTVAAKLDRFKERGERDDNPLVMMHDVLMRQYGERVASRMHRGTVKLWSRS